MAEHLISVHDLRCGYGHKEIVHGVSLSMEAGEFACIIGANGCGKTTLLKNILCLEKPFSGDVRMHGRTVVKMTEQERARIFAYLPQAHTPPFPFTVADVVLMGRSPYLDRFSRIERRDREIAWEAMCLLGIEGSCSSYVYEAFRWPAPAYPNRALSCPAARPYHHGRANRQSGFRQPADRAFAHARADEIRSERAHGDP